MRFFAIAFLCVTLVGVVVPASGGGERVAEGQNCSVETRQDDDAEIEDRGDLFFVPDALLLSWYS